MTDHRIARLQVAFGHHVLYLPGFLDCGQADAILDALLHIDMAPEVIRMFGTNHVTKRRTVQFGAEYNYNSTAKKPTPWSPLMTTIRQRVETVAGRVDGALVQVYPDGDAGIGWHRDKGCPEIIASLSLGAEREFAFGAGPAQGCREVFRMWLHHGSLLLIPFETNEALKHRLPPAPRITAPRINVTFRRFAAQNDNPANRAARETT